MKAIKDFINLIFNYYPEEKPISSIPSIMPIEAIQSIQNGRIPQINTDTIFLSNGEVCHYIERTILVTQRSIVTGYTGGNSGWSIRIMKGVNYKIGQRKSTPIRERVNEYTKGVLYITNKRIIFAAQKNGFEKKVYSISVITPYKNAIILQFGSASYSLLLPDGNIAFNVIGFLKY